MRLLLLKFVFFIFIFGLSSCSRHVEKERVGEDESTATIINSLDSDSNYKRIVIVPAKLLDVDSVNRVLLSQGISQQDIDKRWKNERLLFSHLIISEDSMSYRLELTEQEALKLGIDKEFYDSMVKNVEFMNSNIREVFESGGQVYIEDYQDAFKDFSE